MSLTPHKPHVTIPKKNLPLAETTPKPSWAKKK